MNFKTLMESEVFSRSEYFEALKEETGKTSTNALSYALRKDLALGKILRVGRNQYSFPSSHVKVVRDRKIPFEIKQEDPFYSATNQAHLMKAIEQLKAGKGTAHELIEDTDE